MEGFQLGGRRQLENTPNFFLTGLRHDRGPKRAELQLRGEFITTQQVRSLSQHLHWFLGLSLDGIAGNCHNATAITIGPRHGPKIGTGGPSGSSAPGLCLFVSATAPVCLLIQRNKA